MALETSTSSALPLGGGLGLGLGNGHAYAATGTLLGLSLGTIALAVGGTILFIIGINTLTNSKEKKVAKQK